MTKSNMLITLLPDIDKVTTEEKYSGSIWPGKESWQYREENGEFMMIEELLQMEEVHAIC